MKKIPKEVKEDLLTRAANLPTLHYKNITEQRVFKGQTLINGGINKDKNGQKIKPDDDMISGTTPKKVEHYKKLRTLWLRAKTEEEAWQRIAYYCSQVKHQFQTSDGK